MRITARRDLAVALALAASRFALRGLYAACTWTAGPGATTLQVARFYVPALGAISLLGAWLVTRVPRREPLLAWPRWLAWRSSRRCSGWASPRSTTC